MPVALIVVAGIWLIVLAPTWLRGRRERRRRPRTYSQIASALERSRARVAGEPVRAQRRHPVSGQVPVAAGHRSPRARQVLRRRRQLTIAVAVVAVGALTVATVVTGQPGWAEGGAVLAALAVLVQLDRTLAILLARRARLRRRRPVPALGPYSSRSQASARASR